MTTKTLRRRFFIYGRTAHPLGAQTHFASSSGLALGSPVLAVPWHGCERFHFLPDGNAGA